MIIKGARKADNWNFIYNQKLSKIIKGKDKWSLIVRKVIRLIVFTKQ